MEKYLSIHSFSLIFFFWVVHLRKIGLKNLASILLLKNLASIQFMLLTHNPLDKSK